MFDLGMIVLVLALAFSLTSLGITLVFWRRDSKPGRWAYLSAIRGWGTAILAIVYLIIEYKFL